MKLSVLIVFLFFLTSCNVDISSNSEKSEIAKQTKDTIVVKKQNILNKSYEVGFYSKSNSYFLLTDKDTLDFDLNVSEYEDDSSVHFNIHHQKPMLFVTLLAYINKCLPLIKEDFKVEKLNSIYIKAPIYYLDLTQELSKDYEQKFGRKSFNHTQINEFLLYSTLNKRLDDFLNPLNKKVKNYSIEKIQIIDKENLDNYFQDTDLKVYPEFAIDGIGMSIQIENK